VNEDRIRLIAGAVALLYLAFIVFKLRTQQLSVNSSLMWLLSGLIMLLLTVFPGLIYWAAQLAGFEVPSNAVFVLWLLTLTALSFSQAVALSKNGDQLRKAAQDNALLRQVLEESKSKGSSASQGDAS
jgi:hypothetical protein